MSSDISSVCQQRDQPSSQMAEGDSAALFRYRFLEKFQQRPNNTSSQQSIYRIPSWLRDLDPNAYEPRVVSIGPYHHGKEQLQAMEEHKHRALNRFLNINGGISFHDIIAEFKRETNFSEKVRNCYTEPLEAQWSDDDVFFHLMVLDGCFLLELLVDGYPIHDPTSITNLPEKHALRSYVKMDMLVLDNQIPLLVLRKLASIIANMVWNRPSATLPIGSENVAIQVENLNINQLIWKFYGTMNDEIPADLDDAHHVLDAYWSKGCIGTGAYDGWASRESADELYYRRVKFLPSSGGGVADGFVAMGSFTDVAFKVSDNICIRLDNCIFYYVFPRQAEPSDQSQNGQAQQNHQSYYVQILSDYLRRILLPILLFFIRIIFSFLTIGVPKGMLSLPRLTIDETTRPTLLNLMAFERFHLLYSETHPVTDYVSLMGSLVRSENDAELLRRESILLCWTNESVVKLFADLTRNVVFNGTRKTNPEIDALCERRPNRPYISEWRRILTPNPTSFLVVLITSYGVVISLVNTIFTIVKYLDERNHGSIVNYNTKTNL